MQEELPATQRLVFGIAAMAVRADIHVIEIRLPSVEPREAVAKVHAPLADRLHLGPEQDDARFERLEQMVVVERLPVLGDALLRELAFGFVGHGKTFHRRARRES